MFRQLAAVLVSTLILIALPTARFAYAEGDQLSNTEPVMMATDPAAETPPDPSLPITGLEQFEHTPTGLTAPHTAPPPHQLAIRFGL